MVLEKPRLCIALDEEQLLGNLRLAASIASEVDDLKLNDDAVDDAGLPPLISPFLEFGLPLFIDMKMDKGQTRMARRAVKAAELGASFVNAFARCDRRLIGPVEDLDGSSCRLLAVTVLTHDSEAYCQEYYRRSLMETVRFLADKAISFGCYGLILPAPALEVVKELDVFKVTPGIRPEGSERKANDQELTATPREAVLAGSKMLIVGSPVSKSNNPLDAVRQIREEMEEAWGELQSGSR